MKHINELERRLNDYFDWNKARMSCFAKMLLALFVSGTVNLQKIAVAFDSEAHIASRYKRLQRFFSLFKIDMNILARFIFSIFFSKEDKLYLTIDRTNWYWGKKKINILTLGICYEGIAIPIFWKLLDKGGNATSKEHIEVIERFIKVFGKEQVVGILADREFGSKELFTWLNKRKMPFYIRIKMNTQVKFFYEKTFNVSKVFKRLKRGETFIQKQPMYVFGQKLFVAAGKNEKDELLIVATNQSPENAVSIYLRRWEIENLFQALKSRGFNFEDTHITKKDRIAKLMSVLAVGFCWAHKVGEWKNAKKPIILKKFFNGQRRPQYSYFRYGLDFLRDVILHIQRRKKQFETCLKQLFPPRNPSKNQPLGDLL